MTEVHYYKQIDLYSNTLFQKYDLFQHIHSMILKYHLLSTVHPQQRFVL